MSNSSPTTAEPAVDPTIGIAMAMALQLDEIRQIYGAECTSFVASFWRESTTTSWEEATFKALQRWTSQHPRLVIDLDF